MALAPEDKSFEDELIQVIAEERESRMLDIAHTSLHLRGFKLMVEGLMSKSANQLSLTQDLEALYTCLDDSMKWADSLLSREAGRKIIEKTINHSKVVH